MDTGSQFNETVTCFKCTSIYPIVLFYSFYPSLVFSLTLSPGPILTCAEHPFARVCFCVRLALSMGHNGWSVLFKRCFSFAIYTMLQLVVTRNSTSTFPSLLHIHSLQLLSHSLPLAHFETTNFCSVKYLCIVWKQWNKSLLKTFATLCQASLCFTVSFLSLHTMGIFTFICLPLTITTIITIRLPTFPSNSRMNKALFNQLEKQVKFCSKVFFFFLISIRVLRFNVPTWHIKEAGLLVCCFYFSCH